MLLVLAESVDAGAFGKAGTDLEELLREGQPAVSGVEEDLAAGLPHDFEGKRGRVGENNRIQRIRWDRL